MKEKQNKGRVVSFRLTDEQFAPYEKKLKKSSMTSSAFFREVFLNSNVNLTINELPPKDYQRLLFIFNKASININQLSYMVNKAHRNGIINESLYLKLNNLLLVVRDHFVLGLSNAH